MRALVKAKAEPGIWMEDRPIPEIGPDDVLVKVHKTGICGTDMHIYKWDEWAQKTIPVPMVMGHEFVGEIVAVGSDVKDFQVGHRVCGEGHVVGVKSPRGPGGNPPRPDTKGIGVNRRRFCRIHFSAHDECLASPPPHIDREVASIFDPFGNAVHTALSFDVLGEDVLITGAGPIGIMGAAVARHVGARHVVITDMNPERLKLATEVADVVPVNIKEQKLREVMDRLGMKEGFDVGLEMSGAPAALDQMIDHMVMGGRVALLGVPAQPFIFDLSKIVFRMITLRGIYGREMFETWHKMLAMLESGLDVRKVITRRMKADDYQEAFRLAAAGEKGKIVLEW